MAGQYYSDYRPVKKVLIGGAFTTYGGVSRPGLAQIVASNAASSPAIPLMLLLD